MNKEIRRLKGEARRLQQRIEKINIRVGQLLARDNVKRKGQR